jgi:2-hydroxychromene-2-carboxylate isomerase
MRPSTLRVRAILLQSPGVLALVARTTGCTEQELTRALAGEAVFDAAHLAQVESYIRHVYGLSS